MAAPLLMPFQPHPVVRQELDACSLEGALNGGEGGPNWCSGSALKICKRSFANSGRFGKIGAGYLDECAACPALSGCNRWIYGYIA